MIKKVTGHPGMFRNTANNAIIVKDDAKFAEYKRKRERELLELNNKRNIEQKISSLENDMASIKNSLAIILQRLSNGN